MDAPQSEAGGELRCKGETQMRVTHLLMRADDCEDRAVGLELLAKGGDCRAHEHSQRELVARKEHLRVCERMYK